MIGKTGVSFRLAAVIVALSVLLGACAALAQVPDPNYRNPYTVETFSRDGQLYDKVIVPGRPPDVKMPPVSVPAADPSAGVNVLSSVPAFTWVYGCSATSAAMIMGYYDNQDYPNMYAGPAGGGLCPMNNETTWGHTHYPAAGNVGECPLSATRQGVDGRAVRGHVDDYWIDYQNEGPDPYIANGWAEHAAGDCTADYMGTNQSKYRQWGRRHELLLCRQRITAVRLHVVRADGSRRLPRDEAVRRVARLHGRYQLLAVHLWLPGQHPGLCLR